MLIAKSVKKLRSVANRVEAGVHGNVRIVSRELIVSQTKNVSLLAHARGGTGSCVFLDWLSKLFPVTHVCVEDIKARTLKRAKKWNTSFSPLEVGKSWFYTQIEKRWELLTLRGWETKEIRDRLRLKKSSKKLSETFDVHCVDSWCLAYHAVDGETILDNTDIFCISPIPIRRRELHRKNPQKGGKRPRYGGTTWNGLIKNTLVKHVKHGLTRVSGFGKKGISLYSLDGQRLCQNAKISDCKVLTRLNFNYKSGVSSPA